MHHWPRTFASPGGHLKQFSLYLTSQRNVSSAHVHVGKDEREAYSGPLTGRAESVVRTTMVYASMQTFQRSLSSSQAISEILGSHLPMLSWFCCSARPTADTAFSTPVIPTVVIAHMPLLIPELLFEKTVKMWVGITRTSYTQWKYALSESRSWKSRWTFVPCLRGAYPAQTRQGLCLTPPLVRI